MALTNACIRSDLVRTMDMTEIRAAQARVVINICSGVCRDKLGDVSLGLDNGRKARARSSRTLYPPPPPPPQDKQSGASLGGWMLLHTSVCMETNQ